jgi:hypothetical protein
VLWFKKKQVCIHCNSNKTKRDFEDQPTCSECQIQILTGREPERICPVDGTVLAKSSSNEIIIDHCPKCMGVWLDAGELEAIKMAAKQSGMSTGMVMGVVINS